MKLTNFVITFVILGVIWAGWRLHSLAPDQPEPVERINAPHYETARDRANLIIAESVGRIDPSMSEICQYAVDDGRRVRAVIVLTVAGCKADIPVTKACTSAVEFIHAASLIVDDIMDQDTFRRGKPTVVAKYGHDAAQMASVQLVASAFIEIHAAVTGARAPDQRGIDILGQVAETLRDLSLGQHREQLRVNACEDVIRQKTGSLFEMSFLCGWYAREGDLAHVAHVRETARQFGELFQIVDDLGDMERDAQRGIVTNYALAHGAERAREHCRDLAANIIARCHEVDIDTSAISEITAYLVEKSRSPQKNNWGKCG
jgi:geranylgeranyl diphosphate synthase type I